MARATLHHDTIIATGATPARWLYVLHGVYGMGRNWSSVARRIVAARPEWGAVLVDLREHGGSRGFPPPHTLAAAAGDVRALAESTGRATDALLGHSFGGKVALVYARTFPDAVRQVWVVDSTPEARPPGGSAVRMMASLRRHPGPFATREDAVRALEADGWAPGVAQWVTTNLERRDGRFHWALDLTAIQALLDDFFAVDAWDVVETPPPGVEVHMLRATRSDVLSPAAADRIAAAARATGRTFLHAVEGGHWLNAENPDAVASLVASRLPGARGAA